MDCGSVWGVFSEEVVMPRRCVHGAWGVVRGPVKGKLCWPWAPGHGALVREVRWLGLHPPLQRGVAGSVSTTAYASGSHIFGTV